MDKNTVHQRCIFVKVLFAPTCILAHLYSIKSLARPLFSFAEHRDSRVATCVYKRLHRDRIYYTVREMSDHTTVSFLHPIESISLLCYAPRCVANVSDRNFRFRFVDSVVRWQRCGSYGDYETTNRNARQLWRCYRNCLTITRVARCSTS